MNILRRIDDLVIERILQPIANRVTKHWDIHTLAHIRIMIGLSTVAHIALICAAAHLYRETTSELQTTYAFLIFLIANDADGMTMIKRLR
jgi:high-affinity nickel permease